ncbi:very short patch repair endonuclease [Dyella amyloliquefaciens]|uniref:very short patch repair endonuclease n=1 Tax=Dyella amyloliquefaciens TaxID=1770545 RepID=UPI001E5930C5|nr:very short patch repair endonuclease [Dyella amyloliquefaciens]
MELELDLRAADKIWTQIMVDKMSAEKRSALMSRIRGKDTLPEMAVRKRLWREGFRYRLHPKGLAGRPDLVLPKWGAVVFVHGCFWHRHNGCSYFRLPKTRTAFWDAKLQRNRERDASALKTLIDAGWRLAVVWECALRRDADHVGELLATWLTMRDDSIEIEEAGSEVKDRPLIVSGR